MCVLCDVRWGAVRSVCCVFCGSVQIGLSCGSGGGGAVARSTNQPTAEPIQVPICLCDRPHVTAGVIVRYQAR